MQVFHRSPACPGCSLGGKDWKHQGEQYYSIFLAVILLNNNLVLNSLIPRLLADGGKEPGYEAALPDSVLQSETVLCFPSCTSFSQEQQLLWLIPHLKTIRWQFQISST